MTFSPSSVLHALMSVACVWLAVLWVCAKSKRVGSLSARTKLFAGAATALLLLIPFTGSPLWIRIFSFHPNPSVPMLGIAFAGLWFRLFDVALFKRGDWNAIWVFGCVGGSVLYLHPMLLGAVDLYFWGWDRAVSAWSVGLLAIAFLACGSRLGVLLLGALLAYRVAALESLNCWDYVMDPIYWLISCGVLAQRGTLAALRRLKWIAQLPAPAGPSAAG
jgi:hypothetical protein